MIKYGFLFSIIFLLSGLESLSAQTSVDSEKTEVADSALTKSGDSVATTETDFDSIPAARADSVYIFSDSVRHVSAHQMKSYLLNPDYAYANDPEYWRKEPPEKLGFLSRLLNSRTFWWTFLTLFLITALIAVYHLAKENSFSWWSRKPKDQLQDVDETSPVEEQDFTRAIKKYQEAGDYRMAIRYMYLQLIFTVREKNKIRFSESATNTEIVRAMINQPYAADFRYLAKAYEYIYYGGMVPKEPLFEKIKNRFESFQQSLSV